MAKRYECSESNENGNGVILTKRLVLEKVQLIHRKNEKHSDKGFPFSNQTMEMQKRKGEDYGIHSVKNEI